MYSENEKYRHHKLWIDFTSSKFLRFFWSLYRKSEKDSRGAEALTCQSGSIGGRTWQNYADTRDLSGSATPLTYKIPVVLDSFRRKSLNM